MKVKKNREKKKLIENKDKRYMALQRRKMAHWQFKPNKHYG